MKMLKTNGSPLAVLYADMCKRVSEANLRLQGVASQGNMAAMLVEARTLQAQCASLVELLEGRLREQGKAKRKGGEQWLKM